jgi:hypothetical protein
MNSEQNPLKNVREFEELLAELDAMIKADFLKFQKELAQLAESHGLNTIFENQITDDCTIESLESIHENKRSIYNGPDKVSSGENDS